jgi:hypothetical protein
MYRPNRESQKDRFLGSGASPGRTHPPAPRPTGGRRELATIGPHWLVFGPEWTGLGSAPPRVSQVPRRWSPAVSTASPWRINHFPTFALSFRVHLQAACGPSCGTDPAPSRRSCPLESPSLSFLRCGLAPPRSGCRTPQPGHRGHGVCVESVTVLKRSSTSQAGRPHPASRESCVLVHHWSMSPLVFRGPPAASPEGRGDPTQSVLGPGPSPGPSPLAGVGTRIRSRRQAMGLSASDARLWDGGRDRPLPARRAGLAPQLCSAGRKKPLVTYTHLSGSGLVWARRE